MKKIKLVGRLLAALMFLSINVIAVDLRNEDGTKYEVKIHDGPSTLNSSIDANSSQFNVCSSCVIEVVGVGSIRANGSERVVIKDGKLRKE